jgi:DNA-binding transcriptional MerR regulator
MYTVKRLADLAGVSVRTLHYYDQIGLLKPTKIAANGYRHYDDSALYRLQQILFYRELDLELLEIKEILDSPDFDLLAALSSHRAMLQGKIKRLQNLIHTVDDTMQHIAGETNMSKKKLFAGFSEEEQKEYEREARLQYGPDRVNESIKRWDSYTEDQRQAIMAESGQIYADIVAAIEAGKAPQDADVQAILERWEANINHFYAPTLDIMRGLAMGYNSHPDFIANFSELHPDLPAYLETAIIQYVDDLETAEITRMLAEDEAESARG